MVFQGFNGATKSALDFINASDFTNFRHSVALGVPDSGNFPGDNGYGLRTFPTDSGAKPVWVMKNNNGNVRDIGSPDLAIPTHIGNGFLRAQGNSVQLGFTYFITDTTNAAWRWNALNLFDYLQIADLNNPKTVNGYIETGVTDGVGTWKSSRTDIAAFSGTDTSITDANCVYDRIKYNSYATNSGGANDAQLYYANLYLATESSPGSNDFRQCAFIGNAVALADCTELYALKADSWSDTEVLLTDIYGLGFYHIVKPDGSVVSGAVS